ncbi:MAG: hypothetical protein HQK53_09020 [Oligoflexia bacterium]|nr:hypothetical protein [Oligoflexia bacterium]
MTGAEISAGNNKADNKIEKIKDLIFNRYEQVKKFIVSKHLDCIIETMMQAEEAGIHYYQEIGRYLSAKNRVYLSEIINQEKNHYRSLNELRSKLKIVA